MPYTPVTFVDGVTPLNAATFNQLENGLEAVDARPAIPTPLQEDKWLKVQGGALVWSDLPVSVVGYGITLPASPVDGQEHVLVDSVAAPTYAWRFRYTAGITDSYKWVFVGGSVLRQGPQGSGSVTAANTWTDLAGGPVLTVPRAGHYEHVAEMRIFLAVSAGAFATWHRVMASTSGSSGDMSSVIPTAQYDGSRVVWSHRRLLVAGETLKLQGKIDAAFETNFSDGVLRLLPVRVS
jgi:hypothetical protein